LIPYSNPLNIKGLYDTVALVVINEYDSLLIESHQCRYTLDGYSSYILDSTQTREVKEMGVKIQLPPAQAAIKAEYSLRERSENPLIRAQELVAIHLVRPDVLESCAYFEDFGLSVDRKTSERAYLHGLKDNRHSVIITKGPSKYEGFSVLASSRDDLETLSKELNLPVEKNDPVRGGEKVTLRDPDGFMVEVVWGLNPIKSTPYTNNTKINKATKKERINVPSVLEIKPAPVHKIGHTVLGISRFFTSLEWYQDTLGLISSDFQVVKDEPIPVVCFFRFDRGDTPTDHHSIAIGGGVEVKNEHTAFEVEDLDDVAAGGEWLKRRGYEHAWGIGRHTLGSQIFDYWRDNVDHIFEHYADGDLYDASRPTGYHYFTKNAQHQWGPSMPKDFMGKPSFEVVKTLIRRLRSDDDLSFPRIKRLLKAAGTE